MISDTLLPLLSLREASPTVVARDASPTVIARGASPEAISTPHVSLRGNSAAVAIWWGEIAAPSARNDRVESGWQQCSTLKDSTLVTFLPAIKAKFKKNCKKCQKDLTKY